MSFMKGSLKKYFLQLFTLALFIGLAGYAVLQLIFPSVSLPEWPFMISGFVLITLGYHLYLLRAMEVEPKKFSLRFIAATGLKMLLYIMVTAAYLFLRPVRAVPFLIAFLILYLLFTAFEMFNVLKVIRTINRK